MSRFSRIDLSMNGEEKQSFKEPAGCFGRLQQKSFGQKLSNLAAPGTNTKEKSKLNQRGITQDVELLQPKAERKIYNTSQIVNIHFSFYFTT